MIKRILATTLVLLVCIGAVYGWEGILTWNPPTTNEDGSPLTDLAGYTVYWGTTSGDYTDQTDVGNVEQFLSTLPNNGLTYYFAVTAYDTSGNESRFSEEVSRTMPAPPDTTPPAPPTGCTFQ